ncbi:hypothetical protein [Amycolatopsis sp. cg9]|uniref:hypothetical protein n=1 Tax=Amycolatopsis sp. cg9 TaxID=3238801 RepID=UPI003524D5D6
MPALAVGGLVNFVAGPAADFPSSGKTWLWTAIGLLLVLSSALQLRAIRAKSVAKGPAPDHELAAVERARIRSILLGVAPGVPVDVPQRRLTGPPEQGGAQVGPDALIAVFDATSPHRLVIVGGPGSGKSTAILRTAVRLAEARPDGPVPVVVSLTGWSGDQALIEWLADNLANEHPLFSRSALLDLVEAGRVLPMFDGLDETSPRGRRTFLDSLERSGLPFVLGCRTAEYKVVAGQAVLAGAAVVRLEPLAPHTVRDYLRDRLRVDDPRWMPLLDVLAAQPEGALAAALATPLSVELVLRAYAAPHTFPAELLDTTRFATAGAVERHLMETALVRAAAGDGIGADEPDERAASWLQFLAAHLTRLDTADLAWWRLGREVKPTVFLAAAALVGCVVGFFGEMAFANSWVAVATGVAAAGVTAFGLVRGVTTEPVRVGIRLRTRRSVIAMAFGAGAGTATSIVVWTFGGLLGSAMGWVVVGIAVGALAALRFAVTESARGNVGLRPLDSLRRDRRMACVQGAVAAWTVVLAAGLAGAFQRGFIWVPMFGVAAGLVGASYSAYARYSISRLWLAWRAALPWQLMEFLEVERRLGLLRQSGDVYQFYHRRLQGYLAAEFRSVRPPLDEDAVSMVLLLRDELVERAFVRADVLAVIEAPSIARLKQEIVAELEDTAGELVSATRLARERFTTVKKRLLARAGVPWPARGAKYFGYFGGPLAAVTVGVLVVVTFPAFSILFTQTIPLLVLSLASVLQPVLWKSDFASLPLDEEYEDERSRVVKRVERWHRAAAEFLAPLHRLPEGLFWDVMVTAAVLAVATASAADFLPSRGAAWSPQLIVMGSAAVLLLLLWFWARPLNARWDALAVDHPDRWPGEQDLPRGAVQARRDAVRAWEVLVEALVTTRVLPMVAARVEVLAKRSYDTKLPDASLKRLGGLTESAQFVPTETSARLNRMFDAMAGGAIGLSGARGIGKSTVLGIFGDRRFGGNPDDLTVVVPAPTEYHSREFLVHLFSRVCLAVLSTEPHTTRRDRRRQRLRSMLPVAVGTLLAIGAARWPSMVEAGTWAWRNLRIVVACVGVALVLSPGATAAARRVSRRPRGDASVAEVARHHLRTLRYLETTTQTATAAVKPPIVELGGSHARQRAEQARTYPELVGEFRDFLAFLVTHLPGRPDRRNPRILVCIDEVDKIAKAEAAERFINDVKTVFGVPGCFFLIAVSEEALASFSRRMLAVRTAFDSAFDTVIQVSRLSLAQTRRLLVQRVLPLPEPYVWLCHALSGGLPRDLNRIVWQLYDIREDKGIDDLDALAAELVRQDLEIVAYGQILQVDGGSDPLLGALRQWFAQTASVPLDHNSLIGHRDNAPAHDITPSGWPPELWAVRERFQAYLYYAAVVLQSFREEGAKVVKQLSTAADDAQNPIRYLAEARAQLSVDAALATAAVDAYRSALAGPSERSGTDPF